MDEPGFSAVSWLPPFRLSPRLLQDGIEVTLPPDALLPFARLRLDGLRAVAEAAAVRADLPPAMLEARLAALAPRDLSRAARTRRWSLHAALAAAGATAALRRLGSERRWMAAAAAARGAFLRALEAGRPPPAAELAEACRTVPQAFAHLGKALPTAEAVAALRPLGALCELGAGFGLFARALERAGMIVIASDPDPRAGIAFPVRTGLDAAASLDLLARGGGTPALLLVWPQPEEGDWFLAPFLRARPGQVVAIASPELDFAWTGGLDVATPEPAQAAGWHALLRLRAMLAAGFEQLAEVPVVAAGWPAALTPLRLWRRR